MESIIAPAALSDIDRLQRAAARAFRLGVLKCDAWSPSMVEKYGDVDVQYPALLRASGHRIEPKTFACLDGHFPSKAQLKDFDGFVITGSKFSAYDPDPWIKQLFGSIKEIRESKKKLLGICFGHQAIAEALGGKVEKIGWNLSHEVVQVDEKFLKEKSFPTPAYGVLCVHQDQVTVVPPQFNTWSSNDFCKVQGMTSDDDNVFTIQAHPEFTPEVLGALLSGKKNIPEPLITDALSRLNEKPNDSLSIGRWIMEEFFKAEIGK